MSGSLLAYLAAAASGALLILWVRTMKHVEMGKRLWLLNSMAAASAISGVAALVRGPGVFAGVMACVSILIGIAFVGLGFLAPQSKQAPAVTVGDRLPAFTAPDENGNPFDVASLQGSPILLKFFRGHW